MSDAVVEIALEWKSKGTQHVQKMNGTVKDIAENIKKIDVSKFHKDLKMTKADLDNMSKSIMKNKNLFTKMGNKAVISARIAKKEYKQLNEVMFKKSNNSYWTKDGNKKVRITKKQYQEYQRLNQEIVNQNMEPLKITIQVDSSKQGNQLKATQDERG